MFRKIFCRVGFHKYIYLAGTDLTDVYYWEHKNKCTVCNKIETIYTKKPDVMVLRETILSSKER